MCLENSLYTWREYIDRIDLGINYSDDLEISRLLIDIKIHAMLY